MTKSKNTKTSGGKSKRSGGARSLTVKVRTAKGRKLSSTRWLQRQLNDPYVAMAKTEGYRSRAAYKLLELDEKFNLLEEGMRIVDLGAAPGGWTQVAARATKADKNAQKDKSQKDKRKVIAIDLLDMEPVAGAFCVQMDFMDEDAPARLIEALQGHGADAVMSDMAAPATGHRQTDHLRIMGLCEAAYDFARDVLRPGGFFLAKVLQGGTENALLSELKRDFTDVRHVKPEASRADSAESYVLARGFRACSE